MRLEYLPVVLGALVLLVAAGIAYDAASPEAKRPFRERRRRRRTEIHVTGEWLVAIGTASLGVALIGGEDWRWTTIAVLTGVILLLLGALLNRAYLREVFLFRGAARRTEENAVPPGTPKENEPRLRIR